MIVRLHRIRTSLLCTRLGAVSIQDTCGAIFPLYLALPFFGGLLKNAFMPIIIEVSPERIMSLDSKTIVECSGGQGSTAGSQGQGQEDVPQKDTTSPITINQNFFSRGPIRAHMGPGRMGFPVWRNTSPSRIPIWRSTSPSRIRCSLPSPLP